MRARLLALALLLAGCRALPTAPWRRGCTVRARVTRPEPGTYDVELDVRLDGRRLGRPRAAVRFDRWSTFTLGEPLPAPPLPAATDPEPEPGAEEARGLRRGVVIAVRCNSQEAAERVDLEVRLFVVEDGRVEELRETLDLALGERARLRR